MTRYILTSFHYQGAIQFNYDDAGLLVFFSTLDAVLAENIKLRLLQKLPREEHSLEELRATEFFTIKKVTEDLSFENFWSEYGQKIHPHRCEPLWKKLSDVKKLSALQAISPYKHYCDRKGQYVVNPENYLKKEYWKTDWKKEI